MARQSSAIDDLLKVRLQTQPGDQVLFRTRKARGSTPPPASSRPVPTLFSMTGAGMYPTFVPPKMAPPPVQRQAPRHDRTAHTRVFSRAMVIAIALIIGSGVAIGAYAGFGSSAATTALVVEPVKPTIEPIELTPRGAPSPMIYEPPPPPYGSFVAARVHGAAAAIAKIDWVPLELPSAKLATKSATTKSAKTTKPAKKTKRSTKKSKKR